MSRVTVPCVFCQTLNRVALDKPGPRCGSCGRPLLLDRPVPVGDGSFEAVVAGAEVPVLVDCYADWCGPCKVIAPIMDDIAASRQGAVLVTKLDTDRNQATSLRLGVRGIPTVIAFRQGKESGRVVGAVGRARIEDLLGDAPPA